MATVGDQLTAPESGWKRYDNKHSYINLKGGGSESSPNLYGGTHYYFGSSGQVQFRFKGTGLRIITYRASNRSTDVKITINGQEYHYNEAGSAQNITLIFELLNLDKNVIYNVVITPTNGMATLDALDVQSGELVASVGNQITSPESGWKRYSYRNIPLKGEGLDFNDSYNQISTDVEISIDFIGTKFRFIGWRYTTRSSDIQVELDGLIIDSFSELGSDQESTLFYEISGLENVKHSIKFRSNDSTIFSLSDIDIDNTGRLLHPDEVTDIRDLEVGKRIRCHYTASANKVGAFSNLGEETYVDGINDFIPTSSSATPNGDFYYIMVEDWNGRKRLVADRNIQHSISWDTLNSAGIASGSGVPLSSLEVESPIINSDFELGESIGWVFNKHLPQADGTKGTGVKTDWSTSGGKSFYLNCAYSSTFSSQHHIGIQQTVDLTNIDKIIFDAKTLSHEDVQNNYGHSYFIVDGVTYWDKTERNVEFLNQEIDVSNLTGKKVIEFRGSVESVAVLRYADFYVDNIRVVMNDGNTFQSSDFNYVTRILTGGIDATDPNNEWDKYIVNNVSSVPNMTSNTTPEGVVNQSSTYADAGITLGYKAFNNDNSDFWESNGTFPSWLSYKHKKTKVVKSYGIKVPYFPSTTGNIAYVPTAWEFQGYDGSSWVTLDTQTITYTNWRPNVEKYFTIDNDTLYEDYRLFISNGVRNDGGSGSIPICISKLGIYEHSFVAGDNNVWNWNGIWSWSSTTSSSSAYRSSRGNEFASSWSAGANGTAHLTNLGGFRPILEIERLSVIKALVYHENAWKTYNQQTGAWEVVTTAAEPTEVDFNDYGMEAIDPTIVAPVLTDGKLFYRVANPDSTVPSMQQQISAVPKAQLVIADGLFDLRDVKEIHQILLEFLESGNGHVRVLLTRDGIDWYKWDGISFVLVGSSLTEGGGPDAQLAAAEGNTKADIESLTWEEIKQFYSSTPDGSPDFIGFAFLLEIASSAGEAANRNISFDLRLKGKYRQADSSEIAIKWGNYSVEFINNTGSTITYRGNYEDAKLKRYFL
ncbi:hypothetical protein LC040_12065 [Bacillus tianshenii]|nr:hypothetical protein LC040_12065 [Bacillus tianshenii]